MKFMSVSVDLEGFIPEASKIIFLFHSQKFLV